MILITYTSTSAQGLAQRLGRPEYSYRFVLNEFQPLLQQLGTVIEVTDPELEVDTIYAEATARGEPCIFLCFLPPSKTPLRLVCPTVPVFAWEFETLPDEAFGGKPRNDWRRVLTRLGAALTHSSYTVNRTRVALGPDFPIESVPAPLWERMQKVRQVTKPSHALSVKGMVIDSTRTNLHAYRKRALREAAPNVLPLPSNMAEYQGRIDLHGVVYTAIFNPGDARKNWLIMINAFCEALRDKRDATLLVKLTHYDPSPIIPHMLEAIYTTGLASCRVLLVHAYLHEHEYNELLRNSTYTVNVSTGEGQCLPLMEYMSAGIPAVACRHTSMNDYINHESAFVVDSSQEPGAWPHDQRQAIRTTRHRIHYQSLVQAYRNSYHVARYEPDVYAAMSQSAINSLEQYCSMRVIKPRLEKFLHALTTEQSETIAVPSANAANLF